MPSMRRSVYVGVAAAASLASVWAAIAYIARADSIPPPRVGERVELVIARWGTPDFDSRINRDDPDSQETNYRLGYMARWGRRHHLRVENDVVVEVTESSR